MHWSTIIYCGIVTYLTRFSMIFLLKKDILNEFISRLKSDNIEQELDKSLIQVKKIATLRINEIISDE